MGKRTLKTFLITVLTVLCCVFVTNLGQQSNVKAADNVFEMMKGGSIRIVEPYGLRFQVKMDETVAKNAEKVGMLIFPADYLEDNGVTGDIYYRSVQDISESSQKIDLNLTNKLYEKDGFWYGNGAIVEIKEQNLSREFVGIAYYIMNGETVWADTTKLADTTRSAAQVALLTHADKTHTYSAESISLLLKYIDRLKAADVEEGAPTRFQVRGYAAANGLRFYVTQYVDQVIDTGDKLTEQTHLEVEILQENISGDGNATCCKFWVDDTYECDNSSSVKSVINEATVIDRGASFEAYRYKILYELFIELEDSVEEPWANVQFKHYLSDNTEEGLYYADKKYIDEDGAGYFWQDKCNSLEVRPEGIVAKNSDLLSVSEVNLEVGEEAYIRDKVSLISGETLNWSSDNTGVAVVEDGFIKATKTGTANVTVTTSNNRISVCIVNVSEATIDPLKLNLASTSLGVGETITLCSVNEDNRSVTYSSSDDSILTVTKAGVVSGLKSGYASVTATDHYGKTDTCYILIVDDNSEFVMDGDISEWFESGNGKYQGYTYSDLEGTNRTVTVYSVLREDGIYIGGEATHNFRSENYSTWYWNTNLEVYVTRGTTMEQKWVTYNNNASDVVAALETVDNEGVYNTTFEMFIPYEETAFDELSYARIGWAFKNKGDSLTVTRSNSTAQTNPDWWWPDSHQPDDMSAHWYVYQDGMYETTVYYRQNFDNIADGSLPSDWSLEISTGGTAKVSDGKLYLQGTDSSISPVLVLDYLPDTNNYAVEFDVSFKSVVEKNYRWASLVFDYTENDSYWHVSLRRNGKANIDLRSISASKWTETNDLGQLLAENLNFGEAKHIRIELNDNIVTYYIDGTQYAQHTLSKTRGDGKLGLSCCLSEVYFDNFEIKALEVE